jgi:hypothetical protein
VSIRALVGLACAGLLLTGCGSSLGIHPGAAAIVGDETLSMSRIDSTTTRFCKAYLAQAQQSSSSQSGPLPMGTLRSYAAASLAQRALGDQLAKTYGVQPASGYQSTVSSYQQALASSPPDQLDAVIQVAAAQAYLQNVEVAVGQQLTGNQGQSNADLKAALQRGQVAAQDWLKSHRVVIDPVFDVSVDGGKFTPKDDQTSYALSPLASAGVGSASSPQSSYTSQLPAAQVCGTS